MTTPYDQANDMLDEFVAIKLVDGVTLAIGTSWSDTADYRMAHGTGGKSVPPLVADRTITIQAEQVDPHDQSLRYIAMWMSAREARRMARALLDAADQVVG